MPKRRSSEDPFEYLKSKIKKLERKILRGKRRGSETSKSDESPTLRPDLRRGRQRIISSSSSDSSPVRRSEPKDRRKSNKDESSNRRRRILDVLTSTDDDEPEDREESPPSMSIVQEPAVLGAAHQLDAPPEHPAAAAAREGPVDNPVLPESTDPVLDAEFLEILGSDPTKISIFGKDIQKDLAVRFEYCATSGLSKESRKELTDKYLIPANCKGVDAPSLNLEIKAALSEIVLKRDKAIETKQKLLATAISALGEAMTLLLSSKEKNSILMRILMDAGRLLGDCQHNDSLTRRNFILSSLKKDMKDQLQNTKIDSLLFGQNFSDTLKTARAINKSGAELKATAPSKTAAPSASKNWKNAPSTSKNWKNANLGRKQTALKPREKTSAPTKTTRFSSSKQSQSRRNEYSRR